MQAAARGSQEETLLQLLDKGVDVNAEGGALGTPLQAAAWNGNVKILNLILEHGADLNAGGGLYGGALSAAITCKRDDVVKFILSRGADVNQFYHERSVPCQFAGYSVDGGASIQYGGISNDIYCETPLIPP